MLRFEDQIHAAYLDALRSRALEGCESLVTQLSNVETPAEARDRLWTTVIERYRSGPREPWSALILEALRPGLIVSALSVPFLPPSLGLDDLTQQLVLEVLSTALEGPAEPARWTPNRLLTRATYALYDWLIKEKGLRVRELTAGLVTGRIPTQSLLEIAELAADVASGRLPDRPLVVAVQRWAGLSLNALATREGVSFEAFWKQQQRAMAEIRSLLTAA